MNPSKQIIFKSTIIFIVLFSLSGFSLAGEDVTATFTANTIAGKLTNGQVLGKVTFNNVRREENANSYIRGFYNMTGELVTSNPAGYTLCTTNVPGIGVQYYIPTGNKVRCQPSYNQFYIFNWDKGAWGSLYQINADIMQFVVYDASKLQGGGNFTITTMANQWHDSVVGIIGAVNISPNITFNIPPQKTAAIYFPDYPAGNPVIALPFRIGGGGDQNLYASAEKTIQMCLADDNGINSSQFLLVFSGQYQANAAGTFYLQRKGGSATDNNQINYHISVTNPLTHNSQPVTAKESIRWNNIKASSVNTINYTINGKNQPCVPTLLRFKVPRFNYFSKTSGTYLGSVEILFTPSLNN
jgi:hypothetical protein